jgi:hypothetical protein
VTTRPIGIHTICYKPGMAEAVEPGFLPFNVVANPQADRRETAHMLDFWRQGKHRQYRASGLLSPEFRNKTGFTGELLVDFIEQNPGFDVWFVNPSPAYYYLAFNIWEQGEFWHPGLCERASQVFKAAGIAIDPANFPRSTKNTLLFANCWVGTERFWDQFMPFVETIASHAEEYCRIAGNFWPFLFERLFTTFLVMHPEINARYIDNLAIPQILKLASTKIETLLIQDWAPMIDRWDAAKIYTEDQRTIFRNLQSLFRVGLFSDDPAIRYKPRVA